MAASVRLYADSNQEYLDDTLEELLDMDINLFDRGEYIYFDWGLYLGIIAVLLGATTAILGLVAACVSARTKPRQTNQPSAPEMKFGNAEKYS